MVFEISGGHVAARLTAQFPAGSAVSLSSGTVTLTAQLGESDTEYTFMVPFPGEWTLTLVTDGVTTTKTITIGAGETPEVKPAVKRYLLYQGDEYTDVTGGWTLIRLYFDADHTRRWWSNQAMHAPDSDYAYNYFRFSSPGNYTGHHLYTGRNDHTGTLKSFTIPEWAKYMKVRGRCRTQGHGIGLYAFPGTSWTAEDTGPSTRYAWVDIPVNSASDVFSVELSGCQGEEAIMFSNLSGSGADTSGDPLPSPDVSIYEVWFESESDEEA